jgi:putative MATE family efflux protein
MAKNNSITLMTHGSISKQIIGYAIPVFIGYLFQQLYNTVDALIVGNFLGENALAAVTGVGSLIYLFVGFFMGFATGASVIIANAIGAKNHEKTCSAVSTTASFGVILGLIMTLSGYFLTDTMLTWIGTPQNVFDLSSQYLKIYFIGGFFLVLYNMLVGIIRAGGDAKHPLYYLVISSITNVILDIVFITLFHMGVAGAAYATIISEFISMFLCIVQLHREESIIHVSWLHLRMDLTDLKEICVYGLPTGLQGCVIDFANVMIQSYINSFGAAAIAGIGAYSKVEGFVFLPETSFSMALTTFVSQNQGAKQYERSRKGILFGLAVSLIMIETVGVFIFAFAPTLISFFNQNPEVIQIGADRARVCAFFYCLLGFSHVVSSILRGLGRPVMPMVVMLVCWCAVRVLVLMTIGQQVHDLFLTYWLYPITWALSSIVYVFDLRKYHLFTPKVNEE